MLAMSLNWAVHDFTEKYMNTLPTKLDKEFADMILMFLDELFSPEFMPTSNRYAKMDSGDMPVGYIAGWNDTEADDLLTNYSDARYDLTDDFKFSPSTANDLCAAGKILYTELLPSRVADLGMIAGYKLFLDSYIKLFAALGLIEFRQTKKGQYMLKLIKNIIMNDFNSTREKYNSILDEDMRTYSDNIIMTASKNKFIML